MAHRQAGGILTTWLQFSGESARKKRERDKGIIMACVLATLKGKNNQTVLLPRLTISSEEGTRATVI